MEFSRTDAVLIAGLVLSAACTTPNDTDEPSDATGNAVVNPSGLVAAYGFEEGSGTTAKDRSGSGNAGSLSGATWTSAGRFGGALSFNGHSSWVTVADAASLDLRSALTLEAWVKPTAMSNWS